MTKLFAIICYLSLSASLFAQKNNKQGKNNLKDIEISLQRVGLMSRNIVSYNLTYKNNSWNANFHPSSAKDQINITNADSILFATFIELKKNRIFHLPDQKKLKLQGAVDDGVEYRLKYTIGTNSGSYIYNNPEDYLDMNKNVKALEYFCNIIKIFQKLFPTK